MNHTAIKMDKSVNMLWAQYLTLRNINHSIYTFNLKKLI